MAGIRIFSKPFSLVTLGGILPLQEYSGDVLSDVLGEYHRASLLNLLGLLATSPG